MPDTLPTGGGSRGVIVTATGPTMRSVLREHSLPTFQRLADR